MSMWTVNRGEIVIYQGALKVAAKGYAWPSLSQIAAMFECDMSLISRHLRYVYATTEQDRAATVAFFCNNCRRSGSRGERSPRR